ncbi:hypothetical protein [Glutamicibacter ardleyensis]|uniref:hypothetical protein n=1 Tax=Glutamicibacter ardleyensis TaxID=225894 RepID=UPI003FD69E4E
MENIFAALVGGAIGSILIAFLNLVVTKMNNDNQRTISENNAAWQAEREVDDAWRRETYEHAVWVRERKEKLYSDYLVQAETLKITKTTGISSHETQMQLVNAFTVLTEPNLLVIASKQVSENVMSLQEVTRKYFTTLAKANSGEPDWSNWKETPEVREAYLKFREKVNQLSNSMRNDLGLEPIYKTSSEGTE